MGNPMFGVLHSAEPEMPRSLSMRKKSLKNAFGDFKEGVTTKLILPVCWDPTAGKIIKIMDRKTTHCRQWKQGF